MSGSLVLRTLLFIRYAHCVGVRIDSSVRKSRVYEPHFDVLLLICIVVAISNVGLYIIFGGVKKKKNDRYDDPLMESGALSVLAPFCIVRRGRRAGMQ